MNGPHSVHVRVRRRVELLVVGSFYAGRVIHCIAPYCIAPYCRSRSIIRSSESCLREAMVRPRRQLMSTVSTTRCAGKVRSSSFALPIAKPRGLWSGSIPLHTRWSHYKHLLPFIQGFVFHTSLLSYQVCQQRCQPALQMASTFDPALESFAKSFV